MKFLIVNEGSRGEFDSYIGNLKNVGELVDSWYEERNELDIDFRDLEFGGISDKNCFIEIIFDEEDSYKIYELINFEKGLFISDEYKFEEFVDVNNYELVRKS